MNINISRECAIEVHALVHVVEVITFLLLSEKVSLVVGLTVSLVSMCKSTAMNEKIVGAYTIALKIDLPVDVT